jgi:hypothetical protein
MRTWTKLVPAVLLAMSLTLAPVHADELNADKIAKLQKDVEELKKEVESLKRGTAQDIREIKELLKQMAQQGGPVVSRSGYTPGTGGVGNGGAPANGTGKVTLRNQYEASATFRINGRSYSVAPFRTTIIPDVPLGTITWDVSVEGYGLIHPTTTVPLTPNGRIINVFPIQE